MGTIIIICIHNSLDSHLLSMKSLCVNIPDQVVQIFVLVLRLCSFGERKIQLQTRSLQTFIQPIGIQWVYNIYSAIIYSIAIKKMCVLNSFLFVMGILFRYAYCFTLFTFVSVTMCIK